MRSGLLKGLPFAVLLAGMAWSRGTFAEALGAFAFVMVTVWVGIVMGRANAMRARSDGRLRPPGWIEGQ